MKTNYLTFFLIAVIISLGIYIFVNKSKSVVEIQPTMQKQTETITPTPVENDTQTLEKQIKQQLVLKHGQTAENLNVVAKRIDGNYAQGGAGGQGGGGMWFAVKQSGGWKLVWDGNGIILCSDLTSYPDFPNSMIPECYDKQLDKLITR